MATTVAPAIGGMAIAVATVLAVANYSALTGVESRIINSLPWLLSHPCNRRRLLWNVRNGTGLQEAPNPLPLKRERG